MKARAINLGFDDFWGRPGAGTGAGFYNNARRYTGDVFMLLNPAHFNPHWMEVVDDATRETVRRRGEAKPGRTTQAFNGT